ncbi:SprT-like domain-containing protein [Parendozoicomonas haliclonae]|uniref:SprT-like domain-containing protein n=1 Tax=Parendozoicomonas haliclonae TaxID=1960125 RepID=A0A1X7AIB9_9GAMM|nr:SprT-like domain-containing protein [Parendozoicomonas haliclonae]SMA43678.1 hypothetical protein EHSB41UT_01644 [Parendozoicomonas haliclonae]
MSYEIITKRVRELIYRASCHYDMPFSPPKVLIDLTGADAGQAIYEDNLLRFNMEFCRFNQSHFVHNIVAHEIAHLIAPKIYGLSIPAHGQEWQEVMRTVFQVNPTSHHDYDLRQSRLYRFIYGCRCPQKETPLSVIRHNRQQRGIAYFCADCGGKMKFLYEETRYLTFPDRTARLATGAFNTSPLKMPDSCPERLLLRRKTILPE